jgi:hypothetical protein
LAALQSWGAGPAFVQSKALVKGLWLESLRTGQDLVFPHHALEIGQRTGSPGLSAPAWSKLRFLEAPVCEGCGAFFVAECPGAYGRPEAGTAGGSMRQAWRPASAAA